MSPRLLEYYNQELQHIRESVVEFAKESPKTARCLSLSGFGCADPYVECLLEGFAYFTMWVRLKLDTEYPTFTHNLLGITYPHYLALTPPVTVVQLHPDPNEGALNSDFSVEHGASLRDQLGPDDQTTCGCRTVHPMTLWPLEVAQVDHFGNPAAVLGHLATGEPRAKASLRIRLRDSAGIPFDSLSLGALPLYLRGADEQPYRLYGQLLGNACTVFVRAPDSAWVEHLPTNNLRARGFDDEGALLPVVPWAFQGYRLLQEHFALPVRFLFVEFSGLNCALCRCHDGELELVVLFSKHDQRLEGTVDTEQLVPFCTPAINLFPRHYGRIHLSDRVNEHHVIIDRTRLLDFEMHPLQQVNGHSSGPEQPFQPFCAVRDPVRHGREQAYFGVRREPRMLSSKQRRKDPRSTYVGSETFIALVGVNQVLYHRDLRQLGVATLCTNRDLPLFMPIGMHENDFTLRDNVPVMQVCCLARSSWPRASHAHDASAWRLISQLSLNYLSLAERGQGATALRELPRLYDDSSDPALQLQIEGLREVGDKPYTRHLPMPGPIVFDCSLGITLNFDENAFRGTGVFLLGAVFERFLARYMSINSFTETALRTDERGEVMRWQVKPGSRPNL